MKRPIALLFCLLMITMPMAGCIGGDDSSDASDEVLDDWNVHFAATAADLPACDEDTNGRLYYVEADNEFQVCKTTGWEIIDIRGADGADGEPGKTGRDGSPGRDVDQSRIANYENQLSLQNATIASLEYNISKLQSDKDRLENDLNQVENDLNQAENDLYTVIASLQSQINNLSNQLADATTCQLVPFANCAGADLRGTDFTGMDLTGINFRGANLQNTTFDNATLSYAVLDNAIAWNSSFHYTNFRGASLLGTQFWGMYEIDGSCCFGVFGAEMTYADFRHSHLGYTWFSRADLTGAQFGNSFSAGWIIFEFADLSEVDFGNTHFSEINVRESNLYLTDFEDAYLRLVVVNDGTNWQLTTWTNGNTYNAEPAVGMNIENE